MVIILGWSSTTYRHVGEICYGEILKLIICCVFCLKQFAEKEIKIYVSKKKFLFSIKLNVSSRGKEKGSCYPKAISKAI